jgi:hypothetical protein
MGDFETGIETILESRELGPMNKIKAISNLLKDIKPDEFSRVIKAHLALTDLSDEKIVKEIRTFVDSRREKNANNQQYDLQMRKVNYELRRPLGSERVDFDDRRTRDDRHRDLEDECKCDSCGMKCNVCCCVPRFLRQPVIVIAQSAFMLIFGVLFLRWAWYNLFRF